MANKIEIDVSLCEGMAAQGLSQVQICKVLGISYETLMKRKRQSKTFKAIIDRGRAKGVAKVANALFNNATSGNINAQKYFLSNRDPDRWHERKEAPLDDSATPQVIQIEYVTKNDSDTSE